MSLSYFGKASLVPVNTLVQNAAKQAGSRAVFRQLAYPDVWVVLHNGVETPIWLILARAGYSWSAYDVCQT